MVQPSRLPEMEGAVAILQADLGCEFRRAGVAMVSSRDAREPSLRWMTWKRPSSAASAASWSRRAWPAPAKCRRCSRSSAAIRSAATIPAPAAAARSTRSAAARKEQRFTTGIPMASQTNIVASDPEILGGIPVFRGTRVPFKNLLDYLEAGHPLDEFLDQFPSLAEKRPSRRWNTRKSS